MYSSADLRDMASAAPESTIEETIEGQIQKQITEAQLEHVQYLISNEQRFNCYVTMAMKKFNLNQDEAIEFVADCIERSTAARRKILDQTISALHALCEHRKEEYRSTL